MPLLTITSNISLDDEASSRPASLLSKPESYVMISLRHSTTMNFAGNPSPRAMLELKLLGLCGSNKQQIE